MGFYNTCHTFCTAIADLYSVSIKDFTEFVGFGEMMFKQVKERFCDISGNSSTVNYSIKDRRCSQNVVTLTN